MGTLVPALPVASPYQEEGEEEEFFKFKEEGYEDHLTALKDLEKAYEGTYVDSIEYVLLPFIWVSHRGY